ncbi:MAG: ABC transporter permease [Acidobacteriia bacterium]|nr:ABC transporter permease [Terriglobia bacterium]
MRKRKNLTDLDQDIRDHIERETEDNIDRGMSPEEARAAALRKFGNVSLVKEDTWRVWNPVWLEQLLQDLRYCARTLRRSPAFTVVVTLTLAVAIGMNTAAFSIVNAVLLKPLTYSNPDRWVWVANYNRQFKNELVSGPDFLDWRAQAQSFEGLAGYDYQDSTIATGESATEERIAQVSNEFWQLSGAQTTAGRLPRAEDQDALLLTARFFERRFGGDPRVIGSTVTLEGRPVTIVGVLAPGFRFLLPMQQSFNDRREIEAYTPLGISPETEIRGGPTAVIHVAGKLKPGVALEQARAEIETIQARIAKANPEWFYGDFQVHVDPLQEKLVGSSRPALMVLSAAAALVLLIACANVVSLLLARASARRREVAIRAAAGAGKGRVFRQFFAEGMLLAAMGGAAGVLVAYGAMATILRLSRNAVPRIGEAVIDGRVLAFTAAISIGVAIVFGFAPAISLWKTNLHSTLKDGARTFSASSTSLRFRGLLVAGELALAVVLLVGAGLLVKSFRLMNSHPPGFAPERVLVMTVVLSGPAYAGRPAQEAYMTEVLRRIESVPGVEAAGISNPFMQGVAKVEGKPAPSRGQPPQMVTFSMASAAYGKAIGMQLVKGRWTTDGEPARVLVINRSFARRIFDSEDPLGRRIRVPGALGDEEPYATVVGIVDDLKHSKLDAEPQPEVLVPYKQSPFLRGANVTVRVAGDPLVVAPALRQLISEIDKSQPVYDVKTLEEALADSIAPRRFNLYLLGTLATVALLLAVIGVYGVIAYSVAQRTHEIGVRMALGATRPEVIGMVVRQGLGVALAGIGIGVAGAFMLTRMMESLLYQVKPTDPQTFAAVAIALTLTALIASWGPALKAALVDPVIALRCE